MPEPVSTSELLLQQIAGDLRDVKALLQQEPRTAAVQPPQPRPGPQSGKKGQGPKRAPVDGR